MSTIEIHLPPMFRHLTGAGAAVRVSGATVGESVENLVRRYPQLKQYLLAGDGGIKHGISLFLNGENAFPDGLSRPVRDGDELHIAQMVLGG
jgi:molybdopterin synthase sulfur carrier subunit